MESLARGKKEYEPARFMTVNTAVEQLLEVEENIGRNAYSKNDLAVGIARLGQKDQVIVAAPLEKLVDYDFGKPLHSLVIPAREMHFHEKEVLDQFLIPTK